MNRSPLPTIFETKNSREEVVAYTFWKNHQAMLLKGL
ncbi:hypothetical protein L584_16165 [Pantoea agglomerans Tx10]|nr:hypothetical protein L584_16165 [Pantoea agglomerans Tx10]